jgi:LPXTG-motif cell wall-anchored protein
MSTNASASIIYSGVQDITLTLANEGDVFTINAGNFSVAHVTEKAVVADLAPGGVIGRIGSAFLASVNPTKQRLTFALTIAQPNGHPKFYNRGQAILIAGPVGPGATLRRRGDLNTLNNGPFGPGTVSGFVGFKSTQTGDLGWIDVKVFDRNSDGFPDEIEIIDSAYNNTPGGAINAGETTDPTPEPGTAALGLLALGATGILALRKRRKEVAGN